MDIRITKYQPDKDISVVEFYKLSGPYLSYYNKVNFIKEKYLAPLSEHYEPPKEEKEEEDHDEN